MGEKFIPGGPPRYMHQREGLRKIIETKGVTALLMDPGTGKTATTLDYCSLLALKLGVARVLVVAPLAAVDTWVDQAGKWVSPQVNYWAEAVGGSVLERGLTLALRGRDPFKSVPGKDAKAIRAHRPKSWATASRPAVRPQDGPSRLPGPLLILEAINLDAMAQRGTLGSLTMADFMLRAVKRFKPDLIVVDESHKIKGSDANASRLLARISPHVPRRLILTGTVMPHSPLDVYGQWRFLAPKAFGEVDEYGNRQDATLRYFKERFVQWGGYMGMEMKKFINLDELQDTMAENAIVVRKEDALDLPPTTDTVVHVELSAKEKKAYSEMKKKLAAEVRQGDPKLVATNRLAQQMRLRQIIAGHLPDDQGNIHTIGNSKARTVASLVNDTLAGEKRVVVFAVFKHEIEALTKALTSRGRELQVITGSTPNKERLAMRKRFGSDDPTPLVMIAQIKTISLSVNELVTASHAIFSSLSRQRDEWVQARDRLHRIGQTKPVTFWYTEAPGTLDSVIHRSHIEKADLETAVLKHILESEQ